MTDIYICGDSISAAYDPVSTLFTGWGQVLGAFLPGARIHDHAMAGRSTRTFISEGRLDRLSRMEKDSLMLIQFGHNDESDKPERHADPWTAYYDNLKIFVSFARERGALPVLLTPVCMRVFKDGVLQETHGEYPAAMRAAAEETGTPLIDMYRFSFDTVSAAGEEGSRALFMFISPGEDPRYPDGLHDNAHTRRAGAFTFAGYAAAELKALGLVEP